MIVNEQDSNVRCYRFSSPGNFWSVIGATDDYIAKEMFMREYGYTEKRFKNEIRMDRVPFTNKVRCPFFPFPVSLGVLVGTCKFMPRVFADSFTHMDADYNLR